MATQRASGTLHWRSGRGRCWLAGAQGAAPPRARSRSVSPERRPQWCGPRRKRRRRGSRSAAAMAAVVPCALVTSCSATFTGDRLVQRE